MLGVTMKDRHALNICLPILIVVLSTCQTWTSVQAISPNGVLNEVEKVWSGVEDFSCDVTMSATDTESEKRNTWGYLRMKRPGSLRLDLYKTPSAVRSTTSEADFVLFTEENVFYQYSREDKTVHKGVDPGETLLPFVLALVGRKGFDREDFEKNFYIMAHEGVPEEDVDGIPCYLLQLEPKGENKELQPRRKVWLEKSTSFPRRVTIEDASGLRTIRLLNPKTNTGLLSDDLIPLVPSDTTLIDLTETDEVSEF